MAKIISKEEAEKIICFTMGKKHPVRADIERMKTGEFLKIARHEFTWKGHRPTRLINEISRKTGKTFKAKKIKNNEGWIVERLS